MGGKALVQHQVCIDLPGEPVSCWAETDITVLLRKHRDVVFEVHLHKGNNYTVEATEDWFYDTKAKRRVKTGKFQDGERYHVWIGRDFKGFLVLKKDGVELQRYSMLLLNTDNHGSDPKTKPEPITLIYGGQSGVSGTPKLANFWQYPSGSSSATTGQATYRPNWQLGLSGLSSGMTTIDDQYSCRMLLPLAAPTAQAETSQVMHIFEVDVKTIPNDLITALENGGADETAIDTAHVATRNWIIGQVAGFFGYVGDNLPWIRELMKSKFKLIKIVHRNAGPKWYVVFKGTIGSRTEISAAKYSVKNTKILAITGGAGTAKSMAQAAWRSAKGSMTTKAGVITLVLTIALDFAEWYHDYKQVDASGKPRKDLCDLFAKIGIDLVVAGLTAALTSMVVGAIASAAAIAAVPVALTVAVAIGVAVAVGYIVNYVDKKVEFTKWVANKLREIGESYEKYMPKDYNPYSPMFGALP
ncbi:hypothetical protein [Burkholderia diffusa]|uniref:Uncharacterized protein n=1 Tax=Burkholderia diffusa TaxID=488732 RepID=A0A6P2KKF9_9BURK|nr:hypothetical protein [Burkholderia diffusa]KAB0661124.1 hypothetical protein F7R23_06495 [Burkholderia diffusa]MBM2654169.1 hypothetical protein [Burkholderia diffusa]VWB56250.1 hypothetical protein BDI24065_02610 [Burkholderia diffusa]